MPDDLPKEASNLADRARDVLQRVDQAGLSVATAESCTGGLLASLLTDIEGLSNRFERGFVTYTEEAKCELLGLDPGIIERHGVVSREVARAMAEGALLHSNADLAVGITGFASKATSHTEEDGLVHLAVVRKGRRPILRECHFGDAGRDRTRAMAAGAALEMVDEALAEEG